MHSLNSNETFPSGSIVMLSVYATFVHVTFCVMAQSSFAFFRKYVPASVLSSTSSSVMPKKSKSSLEAMHSTFSAAFLQYFICASLQWVLFKKKMLRLYSILSSLFHSISSQQGFGVLLHKIRVEHQQKFCPVFDCELHDHTLTVH